MQARDDDDESHIPTLTNSDRMNSSRMLFRTFRNQNNWIIAALMAMSDQ
jgi:hypothetical protein